ALWEAGEDFDATFASPSSARVGYAQEWADSALDTSFGYRQNRSDVDTLELTFDDLGFPDTIEQISGDVTEHRFDAAIALSLATDAPSSYTFSLNASHVDYTGEDTNYYPS